MLFSSYEIHVSPILLHLEVRNSMLNFLSLPWNQTTFVGYFLEICFGNLAILTYMLANGAVLLLFMSMCIHHRAFFKMFKQFIYEAKRCDDKQFLCKLMQLNISAKEWVKLQICFHFDFKRHSLKFICECVQLVFRLGQNLQSIWNDSADFQRNLHGNHHFQHWFGIFLPLNSLTSAIFSHKSISVCFFPATRLHRFDNGDNYLIGVDKLVKSPNLLLLWQMGIRKLWENVRLCFFQFELAQISHRITKIHPCYDHEYAETDQLSWVRDRQIGFGDICSGNCGDWNSFDIFTSGWRLTNSSLPPFLLWNQWKTVPVLELWEFALPKNRTKSQKSLKIRNLHGRY